MSTRRRIHSVWLTRYRFQKQKNLMLLIVR